MTIKPSEQIWCEDCACENAEDIIDGVNRGRSTARGGTLKAPETCSLCGAELKAGAYVEAITFHVDRRMYILWEEKYIEIGVGLVREESVAANDEKERP
jgi:hypothetical protein